MKWFYLAIISVLFFGVSETVAQTVYSDPTPLQENSKDVKIYFNAVGTPLAGLKATDKIYAHTGFDTASSQWNGVPNWGNNADKYLLTNAGEDLWMLYIGDIRNYYNVPNDENVTGLDFVFRTADKNTQTKDLFLQVYDAGLQISLTSDAKGDIISGETGYVKFTVNTTEKAEITLSVNNETIATVSEATSLIKEYTFVEPGDYEVKATAKSGSETAVETLIFHYLAASSQLDYPGGKPKMGPVSNSDGSVTFCIGAPGKDHIVLMGSWNNYAFEASQVMNYQDTENGRYFWTTVKGLDPAKMYLYYFIIDGGEFVVSDPYARLVIDPWNDKYLDTGAFTGLPDYPYDALNGQNLPLAVYQGNINVYDWQVKDFKGAPPTDLIIYELLFRDFTGTEGKAEGNGTVRKAIQKFDYLLELGVNAIELLPIMEFEGNQSWGYNPNFYFAVDKAYGTPDDYKEFIDLCHQNGIAVFLDMVFNQSSGLHPWYQMYSVTANPFYNLPGDGYSGQNGAPHAYSVLNDWNQGMPMVQEQWKDVIEYWMTEYKFDGFRFDLVKGLGLNNSYKSASDANTDAYNSSRVAEMQYLQDVILKINPNGYCINENLAGAKEENEMATTGMLNWANVNDPGCQFAMGYPSGSDLNRIYAPDYTTYVSTTSSSSQEGRIWGSTVSYLESHDEQRLAYKQDQWGVSGVKGNAIASCQRLGSAAAQMIMVPGAHMIWQFSEMGNAQNTKTDMGNNVDPKIVNWNLLDEPNHRGLYDSYCELIDIRLSNKDMFTEKADFNIQCKESNWSKGRYIISKANNKELVTVINPNTSGSLTMDISFSSSDNSDYKILSKSYSGNPKFDAAKGTVTVPANCYVVIGSKDLTSSAIESVEDMSVSLKAYGAKGEIIVEYALDIVSVYSIEGKNVGKIGRTGTLSVPAGMYILKSGNKSVKVIVQ